MNQQASKAIGVVLLLAAALLSILIAIALSTSSPPGVGAHPCDPSPTPTHQDSSGVDCNTQGHTDSDHQAPLRKVNTVDGGRDRELVFHVSPHSSGAGTNYLDDGDQIEITLPGFELPSSIDTHLIDLSGSGDTNGQMPTNASVSSDSLTLTLPDLTSHVSPYEYLKITISKGTGILTPETPKGFEDTDHPQETGKGYPVGITFIDRAGTERQKAPDDNIIVVENPISSTVPSKAVSVDLVTYADADIGPSEEIVVDFSGDSPDSEFVVPASISNTTTIWIDPEGSTPGFNPSDVRVQGAKVTLTIPTATTSNPRGGNIPDGEYTITFREPTGIKNPYSAGNRIIKVSSTASDYEDDITAVIRRSTDIIPEEGPRGSEFTLDGRGYPEGTVTIYHDAKNIGLIDAGETITSVETNRGAFKVTLTARGVPGEPQYKVKAKDSRGVDDEVVFNIIAGIIFQPVPARVGAPLKITISDWEAGFASEAIAAVSVAGEEAYVVQVIERQDCFDYTGAFRPDGYETVSLEIEVPPHVPPGKQAVSVYGPDELEFFELVDGEPSVVTDKSLCEDSGRTAARGRDSNVKARLKPKAERDPIITETILIVEQGLTLTPDTAARGQEVVITGSGFTRAARGEDHIENVWIGGEKVVDDHSALEVDTVGDFAFTVTVPLDIPDGRHEVLMEGTDTTLGRAMLTIPEAVITLDPAQGARDTEVKITGSGFVAGEVVLVSYGPEIGASIAAQSIAATGALADAQGNFELIFKVPIKAEVGNRYKVTAVAKEEILDGRVTVDAETSHFVLKSVVTVAPASVSPGDHLTISARDLPPFTLVGPIKIAGIDIPPGSEVATDETGSFDAKILIPQIGYGAHTLLVQVAEAVVSRIVRVVPPPLEGPPAQVFKYLIKSGVLSTVWHYDNATQSWSSFDPSLNGEMAALNDLTYVSSGDILWANMNEPEFFQDEQT